jgi:hypothetical protein
MTGLACRKSSEGRHIVGKILRRVICATRPIAAKSEIPAFRFGQVQPNVALLASPRRYARLQAKYEFGAAVAGKYECAER